MLLTFHGRMARRFLAEGAPRASWLTWMIRLMKDRAIELETCGAFWSAIAFRPPCPSPRSGL